jgi:electron transport complex protein RnfG
MKEIIHYGIVLFVIAAIAGVGLYGVNELTRDRIAAAARAALAEGQRIAFPGAATFSEAKSFPLDDKDVTYYDAYDADQDVIGYAIVYAVQGYQSQIRVLTGLYPSGRVSGIRVLSQAETPGLGAEIEAVPSTKTLWSVLAGLFRKHAPTPGTGAVMLPAFQMQFAGKTLDQLVVVKQPTTKNIEAISGATITSDAVVKAVREPAEAFLKWQREKGPEHSRTRTDTDEHGQTRDEVQGSTFQVPGLTSPVSSFESQVTSL